ncbi:MAG: ABC transporter permease [Candidatus Desulforudis sp.]|nr:ABC transporter permease [Desulforudis sp.]
MGVLTKKLIRTIRTTLGQFLAVTAVVMLGISIYVTMNTSYHTMMYSQDKFYLDNNFADYYFHVVRAPQHVTRHIEALPGVVKATGRLQEDVPIVKDGNERATARLVSYPLPMDTEVNRLQLLEGRLFDKDSQGGGVEVLVDPQYAAAHDLTFGDTVMIVTGGHQVPLTVVGTAISPEFVYPMKDASTLFPVPETFGIFMLSHRQAQQILDFSGQLNQVVLQLAPGADAERVAARVEDILEPYGNLAAYPRDDQLSHAVMQAELEGLRLSSIYLPLIFLGIAAAIQYVLLNRMVRAQRGQIGIMKALGYDSGQIMLHYTGYALAVAVLGATLGSGLGLLFVSAITGLYGQFFNLPLVSARPDYAVVGHGFALGLAVATISGLTASRSVTGIHPAESMRPEPPKGGGRVFIEHWGWLWTKLDPSWRLSLRTISRNWVRFGVTVAGVICAVGMLVVALFANDSVDYMLHRHYYQDQDADYVLNFTAPLPEPELTDITRLDGVLAAEPFFQVPVKLSFAGRSEDEVLMGLPADAVMRTLFTDTGRALPVPETGMIVNETAAAKLGVQVGDQVQVETRLGLGPPRHSTFTVEGLNHQLIGGGAYVSLEQANQALQERNLISGVMLRVDPGLAQAVESEINAMTGVSAVLGRQQELDNFYELLDMMVASVAIMVGFAAVLGFAIVYNTAMVNFTERRRELATLRVVGFSFRGVSGLLLKETFLQSVLGVALGLPFGLLLARGMIEAQSTDLYSLPVIISAQSYVLAALGGILFILVAQRFIARGVRRLDLVDVLKNKD